MANEPNYAKKTSSFNEVKASRDTAAVRSNVSWIIMAAVIVAIALFGYVVLYPHAGANNSASTNVPTSSAVPTGEPASTIPADGAQAPPPGVNTTAPTH